MATLPVGVEPRFTPGLSESSPRTVVSPLEWVPAVYKTLSGTTQTSLLGWKEGGKNFRVSVAAGCLRLQDIGFRLSAPPRPALRGKEHGGCRWLPRPVLKRPCLNTYTTTTIISPNWQEPPQILCLLSLPPLADALPGLPSRSEQSQRSAPRLFSCLVVA